jgi:regulator of replication initiation timing
MLTLQEIICIFTGNSGFWVAAVFVGLTLIEITPIKFNPWSWFASIIGKAFTGEVMKEIGGLKKDIGGLKQEFGGLKTEVGGLKQEVQEIKKDVGDIREEAKEREATNRRTRILEFGDEILHGVDYSKEHFDQILLDITAYENYCDEHRHYMNSIAEATIKHIKHVYQECLENGGFL